MRLDTKDCVFRYVHMCSRKFLPAWASFDTAPSKRVKLFRHTSIGLRVHSAQYTDNGRGVMV